MRERWTHNPALQTAVPNHSTLFAIAASSKFVSTGSPFPVADSNKDMSTLFELSPYYMAPDKDCLDNRELVNNRRLIYSVFWSTLPMKNIDVIFSRKNPEDLSSLAGTDGRLDHLDIKILRLTLNSTNGESIQIVSPSCSFHDEKTKKISQGPRMTFRQRDLLTVPESRPAHQKSITSKPSVHYSQETPLTNAPHLHHEFSLCSETKRRCRHGPLLPSRAHSITYIKYYN